eukprot:TRINITY_DN27314_c0_g1_i1.p1 TRINITY_DN27314_c0_g1~~TRINITY_DN27314_c0_g1_i1.p1  ORF type:complete len:182 (+),score=19.99 TRINITY_DN27314_c0_g1_i1:55-546(+)
MADTDYELVLQGIRFATLLLCFVFLALTCYWIKHANPSTLSSVTSFRLYMFYTLLAGTLFRLIAAVFLYLNYTYYTSIAAITPYYIISACLDYIGDNFYLSGYIFVVYIWVQLVHLHNTGKLREKRNFLLWGAIGFIWIRALPFLIYCAVQPEDTLTYSIDVV